MGGARQLADILRIGAAPVFASISMARQVNKRGYTMVAWDVPVAA